MGSRKVERNRDRSIIEIVLKTIKNVENFLEVEAALLFGSWARSGGGEWSDIDILVISESVKNIPILERFKISKELTTPRIDLFIYTYEEIIKMLRQNNPLVISALCEGLILRPSRRILELIDFVRRCYRKVENVYVGICEDGGPAGI
ncbi:MAG: nucleotidyltransferase domain-containing protein [Crenarchaeota archaeon]|nr:nucleotidyltransferase domain-containing protein [Thermoproteota archaeon]